MFLTSPKSYAILIKQNNIINEYVNKKALLFVDRLVVNRRNRRK